MSNTFSEGQCQQNAPLSRLICLGEGSSMNLNSVQKSLIYVLSCVISTLVACTCQVLLYKCKVHKDKVGKFFFFFFYGGRIWHVRLRYRGKLVNQVRVKYLYIWHINGANYLTG